MKEARVNEIISTMSSFSKDRYRKDELLDEMFKLQREIVRITFNDEHAENANLKIWDVQNHLENLNNDCNHVADEELQKFKEGSKNLSNLISAEVSGHKGETKVFRELNYIHSKNIVIKNVELNNGFNRTELDAVVITPKHITIVEVKNTKKNIFIDENGNYFRTGEYLALDCNIGEKMLAKEKLLKSVLKQCGFQDIPIKKIVVFTNNSIEVHNKYHKITTCFLSQLAYLIDSSTSNTTISDSEMNSIKNIVTEASIKESYPFMFDVDQYKKDFATLLTMLEEASTKAAQLDKEMEVNEEKETAWNKLKRIFKSNYREVVSGMAAGALTTAISVEIIDLIKKWR